MQLQKFIKIEVVQKIFAHNLDTFEWWTDNPNPKSDFSFWKDYDVTLIIRNPTKDTLVV